MCVCLGKKSPVYGKWKEFYFVIKYGEQQLLYYERESVSHFSDVHVQQVHVGHPWGKPEKQ